MPKFSDNRQPRRLGIVGYSTRALVQAASDLGFEAVAIDAFGDQDLIDAATEVHVIQNWPEDILRAARKVQVDAWLLAGGMENHESIADQLGELAPVLGPTAAQLKQLRSWQFWQSLCSVGVHWPETSESPPADEQSEWLMKPKRSAGGLHIHPAPPSRSALAPVHPLAAGR